MEEEYFTKEILTYMGNKRTFLTKIDEIITFVKNSLGEKNIDIAEGFSGSGIVSRLFKNRIMGDDSQDYKTLYVNDMSGYSETKKTNVIDISKRFMCCRYRNIKSTFEEITIISLQKIIQFHLYQNIGHHKMILI